MREIKFRFFAQTLLLFLALSLPFGVNAQKTDGFLELKLDSKLMKREMPYHVILPVGYSEDSSQKISYSTIYLLHGLGGNYTNWTEKTNLVEYAKKHKFIIVTVEGKNGWYSDSVSAPNDKYESYIIQELIPEVEKKFRAKTDRGHRAIAGLSMGGFGAMKFGLKYPEKFALLGSFSGALGIVPIPAQAMKSFSSVEQVFGADDSEARKKNDVIRLVREINALEKKNLPFIYFDCGTEDFLFKSNRDFADLLLEKGIPHEFRQLPGNHFWNFWDEQIQEFLELSEKKLDK